MMNGSWKNSIRELITPREKEQVGGRGFNAFLYPVNWHEKGLTSKIKSIPFSIIWINAIKRRAEQGFASFWK